ncbi:hypothetical protein ACT3CD_03020 [Geofilum sp. OHC36d9]|uniref:hypothetical protein n=1 Tax=Geofilum sp. OHC36d9 TaxID=3458413 RepID=UPI0040338E49
MPSHRQKLPTNLTADSQKIKITSNSNGSVDEIMTAVPSPYPSELTDINSETTNNRKWEKDTAHNPVSIQAA